MPVHPKEEEATGSKRSAPPPAPHQPNQPPYLTRSITTDELIIDARADLTDQVARESDDSTASSHPMHGTDTKATSGGAATLEHHQANPGPVIAENLGEPASKEELKKRSDELNKK